LYACLQSCYYLLLLLLLTLLLLLLHCHNTLSATAEQQSNLRPSGMLACKEARAFAVAASVAVSGSPICDIRANLEHKVVCWHAETFITAARAAAAAAATVPSLSSVTSR